MLRGVVKAHEHSSLKIDLRSRGLKGSYAGLVLGVGFKLDT